MNFRDMTFCQFYDTCANPCFRALTSDVEAAAELWWHGPGAPIAMFLTKPDCHKEKTNATSE